MDRFPAREDFSEGVVELDGAAASFVGQATFRGCISFSALARSAVERLLPPEIVPATPRAGKSAHPVIFMFGDQTDGGTIFGGFSLPLGVRYREFALTVPFVKHRRGRLLHVFMVRMYSSYFPAIWNGNTHYGFAKQMAKMEWREPLFVITTERDELLAHATIEANAAWQRGPLPEVPNFAAMQAVFRLPILGRRPDGRYVSSYFGLDFAEAWIRPADASVSIDAPLVDGLSTGEHHDLAHGSFQVREMAWRLSWPQPCRF